MKIIATLLLIYFTAAVPLNSSQTALRRIKRSIPTGKGNGTKLAQDFVGLRTDDKNSGTANLKVQSNAAAVPMNDDARMRSKNDNLDSVNEEQRLHQNQQQQQQLQTNNNEPQAQHFEPTQDHHTTHLGANSALAYLLQNKAKHKLNGQTELYTVGDGRESNAAELVLIDGGKMHSPLRDMRGSIACNAKKLADLNGGSGANSKTNYNNIEIGNSNNNNNNNKFGNGFTEINNNYDIANSNANNDNMKISAYDNAYKNSNDQLQLETPMQKPESATCAAPIPDEPEQPQQPQPQQQQQQQHDQEQQQREQQSLQLTCTPNAGHGNGHSNGQGSVVLSISRTGTANSDFNNLGANPTKPNNMNDVLQLANMLLYKFDNIPPFRTTGTQIILNPGGGNLPAMNMQENEDLESMDYIYNPRDSTFRNGPLSGVATSPTLPIPLPLFPPLFFQSQFALHEPAVTQPMNLIETALDKLLAKGVESAESETDGDELELRCPIHHETVKRNGTAGNMKEDVVQVCSCRLFKKKKNI